MNLLSIDIEEWFQVDNFKQVISKDDWDRYESRLERNVDEILELLSEKNIKATFFILGWIAKKHPNVLKKINSLSHELACHGYGHDLIYNMTENEFREDVKKSKSLIEDVTGYKVIGYRAPSFSISDWAIDILQELGFVYDSSLVPFEAHDRYGKLRNYNIQKKLYFKLKDGFYEVPLPCFNFSFLNIPWGGGAYFRIFPYFLFKIGVKSIQRKNGGYLFYIHPWEFDRNQQVIKNIKLQYRLRHYTNIKKTKERFNKLLSDFKFAPIRSIFD